MPEPYHRFVFDTEQRSFVGDFEAMYAAEDVEGFDSWHQEEDRLSLRVSHAVLSGRGFKRILDFGCGKGTFAARLKTADNELLGVDVSPTAIRKAAARYPDCRWMVLGPEGLAAIRQHFDLALAMEVLSYLEGWRAALAQLAERADRLWITLYLPPDPIGFVRSFAELRDAVRDCATIEHELLINGQQLCILAESRRSSQAR